IPRYKQACFLVRIDCGFRTQPVLERIGSDAAAVVNPRRISDRFWRKTLSWGSNPPCTAAGCIPFIDIGTTGHRGRGVVKPADASEGVGSGRLLFHAWFTRGHQRRYSLELGNESAGRNAGEVARQYTNPIGGTVEFRRHPNGAAGV